MRRPTLPATRGLCRAQPPLVFSAHPETSTAASTIFQLRHIRRAAPVGAQMPWTTWGRFAHDSPRARVEVHLPCVLGSRSAGQHALAPPTDGHPPTSGNLNANSTTMQPFPNTDADTTNRHATTTFSQPFPQPSHIRDSPTPTANQPQFNLNHHSSAFQPDQNGGCGGFVRHPQRTASQTGFVCKLPPVSSTVCILCVDVVDTKGTVAFCCGNTYLALVVPTMLYGWSGNCLV